MALAAGAELHGAIRAEIGEATIRFSSVMTVSLMRAPPPRISRRASLRSGKPGAG